MAYCTFISPRTRRALAKALVWSLRRWTISLDSEYGGRAQAESPEWMPASSMCSMTPMTMAWGEEWPVASGEWPVEEDAAADLLPSSASLATDHWPLATSLGS